MNARAKTGGGAVTACAVVTKASAAKTAATQIRRITNGKASAPAGDAAEALGREHQARGRVHCRQGRYLTRIFWPMWSAVGSIPGFKVMSSSTVVLYVPAIEPSVSPLWTT